MNKTEKDFKLFAKDKGINPLLVDDIMGKNNNSLTRTILEEREMHIAPMDIYSRLLYDRQIFFGNEFNTETCNLAIAQLLYLDSVDNRDISIIINSGGGSVIDGLAMIDTMNFIKSDVSTICLGMAASMGAVTLSCGAEGKRFVLPHSRVMIHQVSSGYKGVYSDLKIEFEQTERCRKDVYELLAKNLKKPFEEIEMLCDRNNWFIGQEAIDLGIADKIIEKK